MEKEYPPFLSEIKEQEKFPEQIVLENLFDVFNKEWLIHNVVYQKIEEVLTQGILSPELAKRARHRFAGKFDKVIHHTGYQPSNRISTFYKDINGYVKKWYQITGTALEEVGIIFVPLELENKLRGPLGGDERLARFRVAPRRFRALVGDILNIERTSNDHEQFKRRWEVLKSIALKYQLPIFDRHLNLIWPADISHKDLKEIGINNLSKLTEMESFEKLKQMSIEEIKKQCQIKKN
ncbi:MAG: hypothetical protein AAB525_03250 [Patescibacteria group bacterium]